MGSMTRRRLDRRPALGIAGACALAMVLFEYLPLSFGTDDAVLTGIIRMVITRALGTAMFVVLLAYLGYRVHRPARGWRSLVFCLPPLAVVVNNLPILALLSGAAQVVKPVSYVLLFALQCLLIGTFEETAFRGAVMLIMLERRRASTRQIFWVVVASSAVFGGIHLFNLFAGAGLWPTLQQVGYSFLIGGMCAIVTLRTRCIWLAALLHGIFDFCGFLLPTLGAGSWWDVPTIIFTVLLALAVTAYMVVSLLRLRPEDVEPIFIQEENENVQDRN